MGFWGGAPAFRVDAGFGVLAVLPAFRAGAGFGVLLFFTVPSVPFFTERLSAEVVFVLPFVAVLAATAVSPIISAITGGSSPLWVMHKILCPSGPLIKCGARPCQANGVLNFPIGLLSPVISI